MRKILQVGALLVFMAAPIAFAADIADIPEHPIERELDSVHYPTQSAARFLCGASNVAFSLTEIFWQPAIQDNLAQGVLTGFGKVVQRIVIGGAEMLTFLIPDAQLKYLEPRCAVAIVDPHRPGEP